MSENEPVFERKLNRITNSSGDEEFSVVCYNILCDRAIMSNPKDYFSTPSDIVLRGPHPKLSVRHVQLIKELQWLKADVICLQEVDPFYFPYLVEELGLLGFEGVFATHREDLKDVDGLAIFFNTKKFTMKESKCYRFNEMLSKICELSHFRDSNKNNQRVVQFVKLHEVRTGQPLTIGNVHVVFGDWKEPDMQALQSCLFFQQLQQFLVSSQENTAVPWVLCGDFNMYPYFPLYELITNGKLSDELCEKLNPAKYKYPEIVAINEGEDKDSYILKNCRQYLSHSLQDIKSAYKTVLGNEPILSHYNLECEMQYPVKGTLDFIWYSSDKLQVNGVLEMVNEEVIKPLVACPNKFFPSDHLSLKACFQFK